jgi:MarR family 2-MHQ and catechol resistance regulon transcriptional repressor
MKSIDPGGWDLYLLLWRCYKQVDIKARKTLNHDHSRTVTDIMILETLSRKGPLPVNVLGQQIFLTSGSITSAIDRLENRKMVSRGTRQGDRRVVEVSITDPGRKTAREANRRFCESFGEMGSTLSSEEIDRLSKLLHKLADSL